MQVWLMWFIMLLFDLIIPVVMALFGLSFIRKTPRRKRLRSGYRSKQAIRSEDARKFANRLCGYIWLPTGTVLFVITVVVMLINIGEDTTDLVKTAITLLIVQILVMAVSVIPVEIGLFINFNRKGERRE